MTTNQDELARRLRIAREKAGYETPTDAARAMGLSAPTYLGHENGARGYRASVDRYADFFHVNIEWLLTGRGAMKRTAPNSVTGSETITKDILLTSPELNLLNLPHDLPILGSGACGEDGLFEMNGQVLGTMKRPPRLIGVKDAYALYVQGDSMAPWRQQGSVVVVHPHQPPKIGDYVVVQLHPIDGSSTKPAYIKRLIRRTEKDLRLGQYNPPEEKVFPMRKVATIHKIVDWEEAMGF